MPEIEYASKADLRETEKRLGADISYNRDKIHKNSEDISELKAMYKTLSDLPSTMNSLDKTIVRVCERLDNMGNELKAINGAIKESIQRNKEQDEAIQKVDDKSKVDWAKAITENFWKIVLALGVVYYIAKDFIH